MDEADRAQERIERELAANLAAALEQSSKASDQCGDCGVLLPIVRRPYGRCIHCAAAREKQQQQYRRT